MTDAPRLPAPLQAAGLALVGALTGVASVAVHERPWGLPLVALASLAGLLALPARWGTRPFFALGWSVVVLVAARGRPEGDLPVDADGPGRFLVVLATVLPLLAGITTWVAGRGRRAG